MLTRLLWENSATRLRVIEELGDRPKGWVSLWKIPCWAAILVSHRASPKRGEREESAQEAATPLTNTYKNGCPKEHNDRDVPRPRTCPNREFCD